VSETFQLGGDPDQIRTSARKWSAFSQAASVASSGIRSLDTSEFEGDEAETYQDQINSDLPKHLDTASTAWGVVAAALSSYAGELERHQQTMSALATKAGNQQQTDDSHRSALDRARQSDRSHTLSVQHASLTLKPGEELPPDSYVSHTSGAQRGLTDAKAALQATYDAASTVRSENAEAVRRCRSEIDRAKHLRFAKPPGFWGRLGNAVCGWIADHAGVLLQISSVLKTISGIAGLLALIPIPVFQQVMGGIALVTGGAALLIDVSVKLATGQGSWTQIGLDALCMIPGARMAKLSYAATTGYTAYNVATGKASMSDLVMTAGLGALSMRGGFHTKGGGPKGPDGPNGLPGGKTGGPQFIGMPTHVRYTGSNGAPRYKMVMPQRTGDSVTVQGGVGHHTTVTATRTATGHHVTVDNGGTDVLATHVDDGADIHWGDGSGPAASTRTPSAGQNPYRSAQPYASHGVRVSRDSGQNAMAEQMVRDMDSAHMNPRVDQGQTAGGTGYGNRPDVSGTLNGSQNVHAEYDRVGPGGAQGSRVNGHVDRILTNDPGSILFTVPSP
jgi:hypothetical protein